jgi:hypothetical protein
MTDGEDGTGYERRPGGVPRWVKVAGIVAAVVVLVVVVVMLVGGGADTPTSAPAGHVPPPHSRSGG